MLGWVDVVEEREYVIWAGGGGSHGNLALQGEQLLEQNGCPTCHLLDQQRRCPNLRGLYNKPVQLSDGRTIGSGRFPCPESILDPTRRSFRNLNQT
jgi:cytochrome c oxidase subunit 2